VRGCVRARSRASVQSGPWAASGRIGINRRPGSVVAFGVLDDAIVKGTELSVVVRISRAWVGVQAAATIAAMTSRATASTTNAARNAATGPAARLATGLALGLAGGLARGPTRRTAVCKVNGDDLAGAANAAHSAFRCSKDASVRTPGVGSVGGQCEGKPEHVGITILLYDDVQIVMVIFSILDLKDRACGLRK